VTLFQPKKKSDFIRGYEIEIQDIKFISKSQINFVVTPKKNKS